MYKTEGSQYDAMSNFNVQVCTSLNTQCISLFYESRDYDSQFDTINQDWKKYYFSLENANSSSFYLTFSIKRMQ